MDVLRIRLLCRWSALLLLTYIADAVPIDNGIVGTPTVTCATDHIALNFNTQKPFTGRIFIKGYAYQSECSADGSGRTADTFRITFNQCGVRRSRQITGIALSATVIVSFHSLFLTKVDKAYRVNCFYMETAKHVTQNIDVSMMTTVALDGQVAMPACRYEILSGSAQGAPVRFARIGDPVFHKWTCDSDTPDTFCIRVHSCTVDDGAGGDRIQVLDADGCSIDKYILQNLDYTSDMMAGQESHVFKFADRPALFFNCEIEIRLKDTVFGCANVQPNCVNVNPIGGPGGSGGGSGGGNQYNGVLQQGQLANSGSIGQYQSVLTTQTAYRGSQSAGGLGNLLGLGGLPAGLPDFRSSAYLNPAANGNGPLPIFINGGNAPAPAPGPDPNNPYGLYSLSRQRRMLDDASNPLVADFDLPQKQITVFDIDAGLEDAETSTEELNEARRIIDLLTKPGRTGNRQMALPFEDMVCLTNEKFVGYAVALAGVSITSVSILAVVFIRRKALFGVSWWETGKA